ncbi:SLC26A/SulP transporter domain [Phytophthora cactorum]|nr:SLC26A/SulP transporter domain [Phytophthora cactorum]
MDWIRSVAGFNQRPTNERFVAPKKTPFELVQHYVPIVRWLPNYKIGQDLKFDIVAGITVAMMLIPQEVSLSTIMHVPAHHGLYTAATSPLVYALFGSSTVLSVASGSEVALLTGSILEPIEDEMTSCHCGTILLLVRIFNLSQVADFFSRPVMGGFISLFDSQDYPIQTLYQNLKNIGHSNKNALAKRFFPSPVLSQLFEDPGKATSAQQPAGTNFTDSHGFSLTDEHRSTDSPKSKPVLIAIFLARTLCDLGPLVVCIFGGIVGYILGPKALKLTEPLVPWYGFDNGLIDGGRFGTILLNSLTVSLVVFLSSIAMSKRLAIQRGEDIDTAQELTGIVNMQNAHTQLASIITTLIVIFPLHSTGTLYYLPRATLASIIIVAGYTLVEFKEAKWLTDQTRRVLRLGRFTKRSPVVILGELENGSLCRPQLIPNAQDLNDIIVIRVESSLYFANCEREGVTIHGVVFDAYHMNDLDATTIQVLSDTQEKLAVRKVRFAIANAKGRIRDILATTNLPKRILGGDPRVSVEDAVRLLRTLRLRAHITDFAGTTFRVSGVVMTGHGKQREEKNPPVSLPAPVPAIASSSAKAKGKRPAKSSTNASDQEEQKPQPKKRGRRRLLQDEEQRKARRKAQCKLNQRRYRARSEDSSDYRDFLRGYFLLDAQTLTTWNDPRPMLVAKHFLRGFRSGFALHSIESSFLQESFVRLVCAPELVTQGATTDGIEALLLQLKRYTSYHGTFEVLSSNVTVVHAPTQEMDVQADEEKLTWVVEARGAFRMRISRDTLMLVYPHLLRHHDSIAQRVVGQTIEPEFTATFHFDARAKVTKLDQHIDFAGAFLRILGSAQDVATVLERALISPFSELGLDPQGTTESALTRGSKQLSLKFILL